MSHIFISYSRKDELFARRLVTALTERGADVWIDVERIHAGVRWSSAIQQALDAGHLMIVIISPDSMASINVEDEWQYYLDCRKPVIPVLLRPARVHFQLNRVNYIDFHTLDFDNAFGRLLVELQRRKIRLQPPNPKPITDMTPPRASADAVRAAIGAPFEWCEVSSGAFVYGDNQDSYAADEQHLSLPGFLIAKYPITYDQYQVFIRAKDGFHDSRWWVDLAEPAPNQPGQQEWSIRDHPRENVSWYDAIAFCRWLSWRLGGGYDLGRIDDWLVRLPTEFEWEKAARGTDGRVYPCGDIFSTGFCNTTESGINRTTPVTQYPMGASPCGAMDMGGNVWEWCLSDFDRPAHNAADEDLRVSVRRVVRGGSWGDYYDEARAARRSYFLPVLRFLVFGFRIMRPF